MPKQTFFKLTEEKQQQILDAAIEEFAEQSYNEVKISSIIKRAQIPRSSFYDYFEDKKDIYLHIINLIKQEKQAYMLPVLQGTKDSFFDSFKRLFKAGASFAADYPAYEKIGTKLFEDKKLVREVLGIEDFNVATVYENILKAGISAGEVRSDIDISFIAKTLHVLSSQLMMEGLEDENINLEEWLPQITDKLLIFIKNGVSVS
ncbi:TetR/AcrR family transcriptional regulator [Bacillus sp. HMF5848]|uniref:TetR/AcrR family transcriptional regulator n=1 Tax=Bacillus sp. HMF5848 TaxID=2495421 RepID=UPI000F76BE38|nr:TetR/AcrR family transcriptional regulator [Bacillus sp. HMF5848]RSK27532.1 TetR/AcrR family transcriptional regulator [Bacillus sp. HMF5848]